MTGVGLAKSIVSVIFLGKSPPSLRKPPSLFRSMREEKDKREDEWEKTKTEDVEHSQASKGKVSHTKVGRSGEDESVRKKTTFFGNPLFKVLSLLLNPKCDSL